MTTTPEEHSEDYAEFAAFVAARQHHLLRCAYLVCGDRHLAEDLLQGALVKLAVRWRSLRTGEPEAFLRTVLYRDAVSWWRRHRRELVVATPPEHGHGGRGGRGGRSSQRGHRDLGTDEAGLTEVRLVFANALARLTPKQRAVLVLRFFDDRTVDSTAAVLGVSPGTVKSQTAVALRRLRELAPELIELVGLPREAL